MLSVHLSWGRLARLPRVFGPELGNLHRLCNRIGVPRYAAVAQFVGQTDTGAPERYMHAVEPELWAVAQQLEAELGVIPAELGVIPNEAAVAQIGGVKSGVSGVKNGVTLDA